MSAFTRDQMIAQMVAQNIPRHMAEQAADRELALEAGTQARVAMASVPRPQRFGAPDVIVPHPGFFTLGEAIARVDAAPAIEWPLRLILPWSVLVSDNERKEPYVVITASGPHGRMRLTPRYADAKAKIADLARGKLAGAAAAEIPLELWAKVWVPGGSSRSDVANFGKGVHDALEKIVYRNDQLLHWTHWCRVGTDVDAPRAELTIYPLPISGG